MDKQLVFEDLHAKWHQNAIVPSSGRLSIGYAPFDSALGGGLIERRVHLVRAKMPSSLSTAFTLAMIAMMIKRGTLSGPIVWCGPLRGGHTGQLFGSGLAEMGLRTEQFIFVREPHPLRRMAAFEEALGTSGLGAVINEYGSLSEKTDLWQRSARRLQLACERGTAAGFMVGAAGRANGFETAWHIAPSFNHYASEADWRPVWDVHLDHARGGYPAQASLMWDRHKACLTALPSDIRTASGTTRPPFYDAPYLSQKRITNRHVPDKQASFYHRAS